MKLDILAFGAHADDVEIGMGGTIAKYAQAGFHIGICDLTEAELSSNGTVENRKKEASIASQILGVKLRENLAFPDRGLAINEDYLKRIVAVIRKTKPDYIFSPYAVDRHPDHGNCAHLIDEAVFNAGIMKYKDENEQNAHKVKAHYSYFINGFHHPDFVIDITPNIKDKKDALLAYKSQFIQGESGNETPLTDGYIETVISRERVFGKEVGVPFAEGFKTKKPLIMTNLFGDRK